MIFDSFNAVIIIFILMAIGFIITKTKWYDEKAQAFISKLVFLIALPCTIFVNTTQNFSSGMMAGYLVPLLAIMFAVVGMYLFSKGMSRVARVPEARRGTFTMLATMSNCGFIGFPVAMVTFGSDGTVPTVLFFMVQNVLVNLVGHTEVSHDGVDHGQTDLKTTLKRVFNPLLITSVVSIVMVACGFEYEVLPDFIGKTADMINATTTPLSLIFVGMVIGSMGIKGLKIDRTMTVVLLLRFIAAPMLVLLFGKLLLIDSFIIQVCMIIAALPSMVQVSVMAKAFGADVNYAVTGLFYTTVFSFASIPLYMILTSVIL